MLLANGWKVHDKPTRVKFGTNPDPDMKRPEIQAISGPCQLLVGKGEKKKMDMIGPRVSMVCS